jgi:hypothetical protein
MIFGAVNKESVREGGLSDDVFHIVRFPCLRFFRVLVLIDKCQAIK